MQASTSLIFPSEDSLRVASPGPAGCSLSDQLARSRLGPYAGLYFSLRAKHPPTAEHGLRVAVLLSRWAEFLQLSSHQQDLLELAGLLHDVGKIGVPDKVLQKPEALDQQEQISMALAVEIGLELLQSIGASLELLEIVAHARKPIEESPRNLLPAMLKIVDAYDAMTTAQVFRPALSREHAVEELCSKAGSQFEPELVSSFAELILHAGLELDSKVNKRWLLELKPDADKYFSGLVVSTGSRAVDRMVDSLFHHRLLDSLEDAAIYLDSHGKVLSWNKAAETLSGRAAQSVLHYDWSPSLIGLLNDNSTAVTRETCPIQKSLRTCAKACSNMKLTHLNGNQVQVAMSSIPLFTSTRTLAGIVVLIRDDSRESDLEKKVLTLHAIATQDPLTKVANRAELNRRLSEFVMEHTATSMRGSVIMCDIDFFKRINDTYSHQAGDEALITFAGILRESARKNDLVARYGGEEFVILCEGCDIASATARAEQLRKAVERTPVSAINGRSLTSSFGVTELQPGDDAETFLSRADRALMRAKETGRNRVVDLGAGSAWQRTGNKESPDPEIDSKRSNWLSWFTGNTEPIEIREFLSSVPSQVAFQKLGGFVGDHKAEILSNSEDQISIRIIGGQGRRGDYRVAMIMNIHVQDVQFGTSGRTKVYQNRTQFRVTIHPVKPRDRRHTVVAGQARQIMLSFQSYIVGQEIDDELRASIILPR
jgi:diguanylate cyclase (GGDEF)-like protein